MCIPFLVLWIDGFWDMCVTLFHFQLILIVLLNFAWLNLEWKVLFRTDSSNTRVCFKSLPFTNSKIMKLPLRLVALSIGHFRLGPFLLISNPSQSCSTFHTSSITDLPQLMVFFHFVEVTRKETIKFFSTWS